MPRKIASISGWVTALSTLGSCAGERALNPPLPLPVPPPAAASESVASQPPSGAAREGLLPTPPLSTDEGMWLLNDFPSDRLAKVHGFRPSQGFLDHVRLSAVRLAGGCSGSLVSATGLVMTNHHCAHSCI